MESKVEMISLYDYLGRAAGAELGKEVADAAVKAKETIGRREVSNKKYTGNVMLYRKAFLQEFFESKQR